MDIDFSEAEARRCLELVAAGKFGQGGINYILLSEFLNDPGNRYSNLHLLVEELDEDMSQRARAACTYEGKLVYVHAVMIASGRKIWQVVELATQLHRMDVVASAINAIESILQGDSSSPKVVILEKMGIPSQEFYGIPRPEVITAPGGIIPQDTLYLEWMNPTESPPYRLN